MAIAVQLHTRLGDLEEVQEEMVEPELMVGRREKSGVRMLLLEELGTVEL